ncbi:arylesterase [Dokdonella sp.]|uniref:arylesterase n=1 Tax=Dokdonella sp. TaxID=2291710 RepID=UPI003C4E3CB1
MLRNILLLLFVVLHSSSLLADSPARPVLVLGDSLSAAYGINTDQGWVTLLRDRLQQAQPERGVVNASISGETTAGGLARLENLLTEHKPALIVVELGANDALRGLPLSAPRENLSRILQLSSDADARVLLVGTEIPINYGPQYRDGLRSMYRDLSEEFNVPLVPFLLEGVALDPARMQDDGLHPTAEAQPDLLENVWPALEKTLNDLVAQ